MNFLANQNLYKIAAVVLLLWPLSVGAQSSVKLELSPQDWQEDLKYLAKELPRRHKNAFHTVTREQFEASVAELNTRIPNLKPYEIIVGLMRIVASVSDAHTELSGFGDAFHRFPITVYWFGNELRVTRVGSPYQRAAGARVLKIGNSSIQDIAARVDQLAAHENEYWVRLLDAGFMPYAEILQSLGVISDLKNAQWTFEGTQGKTFTLDLATVASGDKIEWISGSKGLPLYRQKPEEQFWFTFIEPETVYVNFRGYREEFGKHADELLSFIKQHSPKRLVIDVRQNRGGDFTKMRNDLLPGLKDNAQLRKSGSVYVIIGRATQSAAVVNTIDLRKQLGAIVVGEPTGGRPNGYSEHGDFKLPHSHLVVSYSSRYYKFQDVDTPAVMPDKLIEPNWEAYRDGHDAVMEWILAQPLPK